ncbi:MAG: hypothetical protein WDW38_011001 [Sanguina aurantia]
MLTMTAQRGMAMHRVAAPMAQRSPMMRSAAMTVMRPSQLSTSFLGGGCPSLMTAAPSQSRGSLLVVANAKASMGCTKRGTNRKRRRTSGFRLRSSTPAGRKLLKARRQKGRHVLAPASEKGSAGKK